MGKTLDSVLFAGADLLFRIDEEVTNFYDKPGKTPLREASKHLVPSYTTHRIDTVLEGYVPATLIGVGIDLAKMFGYVYLAVEASRFITR